MSASILIATSMDWPFTAQLAHAFAGAGARVETLAPAGSMLALSRFSGRRHRYHAVLPQASLRHAVESAKPALIVPCDDQMAMLVQQMRGEPLPGRAEFLSRIRKAGAPAAEGMALSSVADVELALGRLGLPLVIKSDHSWGGEGVVVARTREDARHAFARLGGRSRLRDVARALRGRGHHWLTRALYPLPHTISAQRHVAGGNATSSIACWRGQVVAAHHFDVLFSTTPTSPASVVRRLDCPQMAASAAAVAAALNLSGLFGLDYIRDGAGTVHLLEINPRATPTMHLSLAHDLPHALLRAAGLESRARPPITDKNEIALFPREWLRDPASPWLARAHHDVPWEDPEVVRACVRAAPAEARALLENAARAPLTAKIAAFGA